METPDSKILRWRIVKSFVIFAAVLGIPLWYMTTAIYKAALPLKDIEAVQSDINNRFLHFCIPVYLDDLTQPLMERLIPETQQSLDSALKNENLPLDWRVVMKNGNQKSLTQDDYVVSVVLSGNEQESVFISPTGKKITVFVSQVVINHNKVADFISKVLLERVFNEELRLLKEEKTPMNAPHYHITFSLMAEDDKALYDWNIKPFLEKWIFPLLQTIKPLAQVTIDTQVHLNAKLSSNTEIALAQQADSSELVLTERDLTTFVNFNEWDLSEKGISSQMETRALNFLLYIPSTHRPAVKVANSVSNSFIIPQWGGVQILNTNQSFLEEQDLLPLFEIFTSQLFSLLGVPANPKSPTMRIESAARAQVYFNLKQAAENLGSLVRLSEKLTEIPIPETAKENAISSLNLIRQTRDLVNSQEVTGHVLMEAKELSSMAKGKSNAAFFDKDMVQQAYFPQEHKLAVYLPLIGPLVIIMSLGVLKMKKQ